MKWKLAAGIILSVAIITALTYYIYIENPFSGYTKITVTEAHGKLVTIDGYEYAFTYDHNTQMFAIATDLTILPPTYKTTVGATYNVYGLEIKVSEAHNDYCVLLAKSTIP